MIAEKRENHNAIRDGRNTLKRFYERSTVKMMAEVGIATVLGLGTVGAIAYFTAPKAPAPVEQKIQKREQSLEELMATTEQVIVRATYSFFPKDIAVYFSGSGVCVYKNIKENLVFYLTCSHVIDVPPELNVFGFSKISDGMYKLNVSGKNSGPLPLDARAFQEVMAGGAKLKSVELGIFNGFARDYNGKLVGMNLIAAELLADTVVSDEADWVDDQDVALLKIDENRVMLNPDRFTLFEGEFADEDELSPGDKVWAIGYPGGLGKQLCSGEIREKNNFATYTLMTTPINFGNSGGPVFLEDTVQEVLKDGTVKTIKSYKLAGLSRIGYFDMLAMTGMSKISLIQDFLRAQGYSYIYQK